MTEQEYIELFDGLKSGIEEKDYFDSDLFYAVFRGKIVPIVKKTYSVNSNDELRQVYDVEDCCQDAFLHLWKKSVAGYFKNGKYKVDPYWFLSWCKIVVTNYVISKLREEMRINKVTTDDPEGVHDIPAKDDFEESIINKEAVNTIYNRVAVLGNDLYMKLAWFTVFSLIYSRKADDKIRAEHIAVNTFGQRTLSEIYGWLIGFTKENPWIVFTDESLEAMKKGLEKTVEGKAYGDCLLSEFLGDGNRISRLSDWIYKINNKLNGALAGEVL